MLTTSEESFQIWKTYYKHYRKELSTGKLESFSKRHRKYILKHFMDSYPEEGEVYITSTVFKNELMIYTEYIGKDVVEDSTYYVPIQNFVI